MTESGESEEAWWGAAKSEAGESEEARDREDESQERERVMGIW